MAFFDFEKSATEFIDKSKGSFAVICNEPLRVEPLRETSTRGILL